MAMASMSGQTVGSTMDNGKTTTCKGTAFTCMPTVLDTTVSTTTIKKTATEYITGQMDADTKDGGTRASSTA